MDYHNPESDLRRYIKNLIIAHNYDKLKIIDNLIPSCPYNKYGPLDIIYTAIDNNAPLDIIKYLVEERQIDSQNGLRRALECNRIDIAKYLKEHNYPLSKDSDHIYSVDVIKLVDEWGYKFSENSIGNIISVWNGDDVNERIKYLYDILGYNFIVELMTFKFINDDELFLYLLDHTDANYNKLMTIACKAGFFRSIYKLLKKNVLIDTNCKKYIVGSYECDEVCKLFQQQGYDLKLYFKYIFKDDNDDYSFVNKLNYYYEYFKSDIQEYYNMLKNYNIMVYACKYLLDDAVQLLMDWDIPITDKAVELCFETECNGLDRGCDIRKSLQQTIFLLQHHQVQWIQDEINDMLGNDDQ